MTPVVQALLSLKVSDFNEGPGEEINIRLGMMRDRFRDALFQANGAIGNVDQIGVAERALAKLSNLIRLSRAIAGTYYGMVSRSISGTLCRIETYRTGIS